MKSFIFVALATVLGATSVQAMAQDTGDVVDVLHLAPDQVSMACGKATRLTVKKTDGSTFLDYNGSNETIRQCIYMKHVNSTKCVVEHQCMTYDEWSAKNVAFSASLPRKEFDKYFEEHYLYAMPEETPIKIEPHANTLNALNDGSGRL